jgi:hypothetical protein
VIQSILTGNTRPAAEIKLRAFGLDRYPDLDVGAYGTDDDDRASLVKIARQRAEAAHGVRFGPASTVLIGDTPTTWPPPATAEPGSSLWQPAATAPRTSPAPEPTRC